MQLLPEVHVYYYHRSYWAIIMPDSEQRDKTYIDNKNTHTPKTRGLETDSDGNMYKTPCI